MLPATAVPSPGADVTISSPPSAASRSAILQTGPVVGRRRVEAPPIVGHLEPEVAGAVRELDPNLARLGILRRVLQRLEAGEVDGRLDVGPEPRDPVGAHRDGHRRLPRLCLERRPEPLVRQQRWVDAPCEVTKVLERLVRRLLQC